MTSDTTPSYTFSSTEAGAITYGGACGNGSLASAVAGNNTVTYGPLSEGAYNNCTIIVTDGSSNASDPLAVNAFAIDANVFAKGLVSLTFDDGTRSILDNAIPVLNGAGFKSTQYIYTVPMFGAEQCKDDPDPKCYADFMTTTDVLSLYASGAGHEIATHTRGHRDLTTLPDAEQLFDVNGSRLDLLQSIGLPVNSMAYPYGELNPAVVSKLQSAGIVGARTVRYIDDFGVEQMNVRSTDRYALWARQVNADTTVAEVEGWIDEAIDNSKWLVLVFHEIQSDCGANSYCASTGNLSSIIAYLSVKDGAVDVITVGQGLEQMNNHPVSDGLAPVITQDDIVAEATSLAGATVAFSPVVADSDAGLPATLGAFCTIPDLQEFIFPGDIASGISFPTMVSSGHVFAIGGPYTVTCTAADTGGNIGTKAFTVTVQDATLPVITRLGDAEVTVQYGDTYTDAGATALDNLDGDITASIVTTGLPVDTSVLDDYVVHYNVTDSHANAAVEVTRTVHVVARPITVTADAKTKASGDSDPALTYQITSGSLVSPDAFSGELSRVAGETVGEYDILQGTLSLSGNYALTYVGAKLTITDTVPPVITLLGDATVTVEVHTDYTDAGATALDNYDGDLTGSIVTVNPVNKDVVGDYTVTYDVTDSNGNAAVQVTRTVHVVDTTKPVITLLGDNPQVIEAGSAYVELGASVSDNYDTVLSAVIDSSAVNTAVVGSYSVTYDAVDSAGNPADQATRTVNVQDTVAPVVTIDSEPTSPTNAPVVTFHVVDETALVVECSTDGATFAACTSPFSPSLADGTYAVTVRATDSGGNAGEAVTSEFIVDATAVTVVSVSSDGQTYNAASTTPQTVTVTFDGDVAIAPAIAVSGDSQSVVDCADADAKTFCFDYAVPVLTDSIVKTIQISGAQDSVGNMMALDVSHTFTVDTLAPSLTVNGPVSTADNTPTITGTSDDDTSIVDVTVNSVTYQATPAAHVWSVTIPDGSELPDGPYTVSAVSTDAAGNASLTAEGSLTVDTTKPALTVNPIAANSTSISGTTDVGADLYVAIADLGQYFEHVPVNPDGTWSVTIAGPVGDGTYGVYVSATDAVSNKAEDNKTLIIDTTAPEFTGVPTDMTVEAESGSGAVVVYADPTATDNIDGPVTVTCTPASGSTFALGGPATVDCSANDAVGHVAHVSFTVTVQDTTAPEFSGVPADMVVEATSAAGADVTYTDPTASDLVDGVVTVTCTPASGSTFAMGPATTVTCTATDVHSNTVQASFTVTVQDTTGPVVTLNGAPVITLHVGDTYTEEGATTSDAVDGAGVATVGGDAVNTAVMGTYTVTYDAVDAAGNAALQVTRTVNVAPMITSEAAAKATTTSITVTWTTDHPATSRVVYDTVSHATPGAAPDYGYAFSTVEADQSPDMVTSHSVTITDLTPGITYFLRAISHGSPETVSKELVVGVGGGGGNPLTPLIDLDVAVARTDAGDATVGSVVSLSITVTNHGPNSATNVVVNSLLPAGLSYVSSSASHGSYDAATGQWNIGALANYASVSLTIGATVNTSAAGTTVTDTATVSAAEQDTVSQNNSSSVSFVVPQVLGAQDTTGSAGPSSGSGSVTQPAPQVLGVNTEDVTAEEQALLGDIDMNLVRRLAGRILLQVERFGQAWYLDPLSLKKYFLVNGQTAYSALRQFGLGITNADLAKIPVGHESRFTMTDTDSDGLPDRLEEGLGTDMNKADTDGDGVNDGTEVLKNNTNPLGAGSLTYSASLVNRLRGRILLQVEGNGEAWYVNPVDGKRYYMANGEAAYQIMRYLSLGITNADIRKIPVGTLQP